jgi:hypothetical protein
VDLQQVQQPGDVFRLPEDGIDAYVATKIGAGYISADQVLIQSLLQRAMQVRAARDPQGPLPEARVQKKGPEHQWLREQIEQDGTAAPDPHLRARNAYRKRESKFFAKAFLIQRMAGQRNPQTGRKFTHRQIQQQLGVNQRQVHRALYPSKKPISTQSPLLRDPNLHEAIFGVLHRMGLKKLSVQAVICALQQSYAGRIPGRTTLALILKREFQLSFRSYNPARVKMCSSRFNEKRLWIARLLAFLLE